MSFILYSPTGEWQKLPMLWRIKNSFIYKKWLLVTAEDNIMNPPSAKLNYAMKYGAVI